MPCVISDMVSAATALRVSKRTPVSHRRVDGSSADRAGAGRQKFGLGHGLSIPVHESGRVVSMLSLGRDRPFESEAEKQSVIAAGKVLANCVHGVQEPHPARLAG